MDYGEFIKNACAIGIKVVIASDLLVLAMLKPPDDGGDYICGGLCLEVWCANGVWSPHAAFSATSQEYKRMMPERIIDV